MANRKVIITCAVTGAIHTPSMSPHLPITPGGRSRLGPWTAAPRLTPLGGSDDGRYVGETLRRLAAEWETRLSHRTGLARTDLLWAGGGATRDILAEAQPELEKRGCDVRDLR